MVLHTGSKTEVLNFDGTKEIGGYEAGWYNLVEFFKITKSIVTMCYDLNKGVRFAEGYEELALSAYIDNWKGCEYWEDPITNEWVNNPHVNPGLVQENFVFDVFL